jgi:hypothetical protein
LSLPRLAPVEQPRPFTPADHAHALEELQAIVATLEGAVEHAEVLARSRG